MSDMAERDELDRIMMRNFGPPHAAAARAESIEPSSGFAASVMERIREEAGAPQPIAFPWKRAIPGICMAVLALAVSVTLLVFAGLAAGHSVAVALTSASLQQGQSGFSGWIQMADRLHLDRLHLSSLLVAVAVAFSPLALSRGLMEHRHRT